MQIFPELDNIGFIQKNQGFDGQAKLKLNVDLIGKSFPQFLWINQFGKPVPFSIEHFQIIDTNTVIAKFEDVEDENAVNKLKNESIWCESSDFINHFAPLESYDYLFGLQVIDTEKGNLGELIDVIENENSHATLVVQHGDKEVLIPFVDEFILEINEVEKFISVALPDGLIELFID